MSDIYVRYYEPIYHPNNGVLIMLHGWSGDQDSMWIFTQQVPEGFIIMSPRGIFPATHGFSWVEKESQEEQKNFKNYLFSANVLAESLIPFIKKKYSKAKIHLMGFSQGAALAYVLLLKYPKLVKSISALSGFIPAGYEKEVCHHQYNDSHIYITHGSDDDIVGIEHARKSALFFYQLGAHVYYCEDETGHKLSAKCFRGFNEFYREVLDIG